MKKSSRYTIIGLGIVVFFVLAPALLLYVSGTRVNLDGRDSRATGILDVKSEPSGASVYVNDEQKNNTPAIVRFLSQGEYELKITKDGYFDWTKRLPIESGQVTYAQVGVDQVQLIKKPDPKTLIPSGVSSFALIDNTLWFTNGKSIIHAPLNHPQNQTVIALDFAPTSITTLRNNRHLYLGNNTVLDTAVTIVFKLPTAPASKILKPNEIGVTPDNNILIPGDNLDLFAYNPTTQNKWLVHKSVYSFTINDGTGYFTEYFGQDETPRITTAFWSGAGFRDFQTLISSDSALGNLYITDNKELFCDCGSQLMRVGQALEPVIYNNLNTHLDFNTNELSFLTTGNELWFYNFLTSKPQLVTRGNLTPQTAFMIRSALGYGFIGNVSGLEVVEIDGRDRLNRYQLLSGKQVWQIAITNNQKTIVALQDGALISIEIRD